MDEAVLEAIQGQSLPAPALCALNPDQAVEYGLVDEVLSKPQSEETKKE